VLLHQVSEACCSSDAAKSAPGCAKPPLNSNKGASAFVSTARDLSETLIRISF
jgi:hypothetical protein